MIKKCLDCGVEIKTANKCSTCYKKQKYFGGKYWQVLKRDDYTCQECGKKQDGVRSLNIHHIDENNKNNNDNNLQTLCINCHKLKRSFNCLDCGVSLIATSPTHKRCRDCSKERRSLQNKLSLAKYYKNKGLNWMSKTLLIKINKK